MCLSYIKIIQINLNKKGEGEGWKKYNDYKGEDLTAVMFQSRGNKLRFNEWLNERQFRCTGHGGGKQLEVDYVHNGKIEKYPYGFHVFLKKGQARCWHHGRSLFKVKFRKIKVTGIQKFSSNNRMFLSEIVIAEEIMILKNNKEA